MCDVAEMPFWQHQWCWWARCIKLLLIVFTFNSVLTVITSWLIIYCTKLWWNLLIKTNRCKYWSHLWGPLDHLRRCSLWTEYYPHHISHTIKTESKIVLNKENSKFSTCWLVLCAPAQILSSLNEQWGWICPRPVFYFPPAGWTVCEGTLPSHL